MSLDVYLIGTKQKPAGSGIFIRDAGETREISREEWDTRFLGKEPRFLVGNEEAGVYHANITHNLGAMAEEAGIYKHLWRPEELGISKALDLIEPLSRGLALMKANPVKFKMLDPDNGWGSYNMFLPWIEKYIQACTENPDAEVRVSR